MPKHVDDSFSNGERKKAEEQEKSAVAATAECSINQQWQDVSNRNCRVCNRPESQMISMFTIEDTEIRILNFCLINEFNDENNIILLCRDCYMMINRCIKNIRQLKLKQLRLPCPKSSCRLGTGTHCWICGITKCIKLIIVAENSSQQIVVYRILKRFVLECSMWICEACEDLVNDLDEVLQSVHNTEMEIIEADSVKENRSLSNYRRISSPIPILNAKPRFSFLNTDMITILNFEQNQAKKNAYFKARNVTVHSRGFPFDKEHHRIYHGNSLYNIENSTLSTFNRRPKFPMKLYPSPPKTFMNSSEEQFSFQGENPEEVKCESFEETELYDSFYRDDNDKVLYDTLGPVSGMSTYKKRRVSWAIEDSTEDNKIITSANLTDRKYGENKISMVQNQNKWNDVSELFVTTGIRVKIAWKIDDSNEDSKTVTSTKSNDRKSEENKISNVQNQKKTDNDDEMWNDVPEEFVTTCKQVQINCEMDGSNEDSKTVRSTNSSDTKSEENEIYVAQNQNKTGKDDETLSDVFEKVSTWKKLQLTLGINGSNEDSKTVTSSDKSSEVSEISVAQNQNKTDGDDEVSDDIFESAEDVSTCENLQLTWAMNGPNEDSKAVTSTDSCDTNSRENEISIAQNQNNTDQDDDGSNEGRKIVISTNLSDKNFGENGIPVAQNQTKADENIDDYITVLEPFSGFSAYRKLHINWSPAGSDGDSWKFSSYKSNSHESEDPKITVDQNQNKTDEAEMPADIYKLWSRCLAYKKLQIPWTSDNVDQHSETVTSVKSNDQTTVNHNILDIKNASERFFESSADKSEKPQIWKIDGPNEGNWIPTVVKAHHKNFYKHVGFENLKH